MFPTDSQPPQDPQALSVPGAPGVPRQSIKPLTKQQILPPESPYSVAFNALIMQHVRQESDREQTRVYAKIRRNNLYYRGLQFLTLVRGDDGVTVDYRPVQGGMEPFSRSATERDEMYDNILPLFRGDVRKWCGVLGVRAPNAKCSPRMVGDDHQIRLSRIGDRGIGYLRSVWAADEAQRYLAYSLAVNGTTFGFVQFVSDKLKYGVTELPKLEQVMVPAGDAQMECWKCGTANPAMPGQQTGQCMACGAPLGPEDYREPEMIPGVIANGTMQYPNGSVELQFGTAATVRTPFYSNADPNCWPWLWYEYLVNKFELIRTYAPLPRPDDNTPDAQWRRKLREYMMADRTSDSFGVSSAEIRRTVNTMSSPSGVPYERKALAALGQYFLSPGMLEALPMDQSGNLRDQILANFPRGVHLIYTNGMLADIRHASIAEHWSICQPDTGEFVYRDAAFDDYIQGQDVVNDCLNIVIQQAEKSNPLTIFDPDVLDPDTLRNKQAQVGEFLEAKKSVGGNLAQGFFKLEPTQMNAALTAFMEFYIQKNRENVGIMPAIYGGGEADEAVGVAKLRRNQSLAQLNIPWNYMRSFWEQSYQNGLRLLARYSNGKLVSPRSGGDIEIEELDGIADLIQGGFKIECEEAMPQTWAQRQEQVDSLLEKNPEAWILMGVSNPDGSPNLENVEALQESTGLADWVVPGLDQKERLLDVIGQLLQQSPVDSPPDPMQPPGSPPPPPAPSIQPNQLIFDAPVAVQVIRGWLRSDKGRDAEAGSLPGQNPRGLDNVMAYAQAWMNLATPPPPEPPPPPPPEPPKISINVNGDQLANPMVQQALASIESGQGN